MALCSIEINGLIETRIAVLIRILIVVSGSFIEVRLQMRVIFIIFAIPCFLKNRVSIGRFIRVDQLLCRADSRRRLSGISRKTVSIPNRNTGNTVNSFFVARPIVIVRSEEIIIISALRIGLNDRQTGKQRIIVSQTLVERFLRNSSGIFPSIRISFFISVKRTYGQHNRFRTDRIGQCAVGHIGIVRTQYPTESFTRIRHILGSRSCKSIIGILQNLLNDFPNFSTPVGRKIVIIRIRLRNQRNTAVIPDQRQIIISA